MNIIFYIIPSLLTLSSFNSIASDWKYGIGTELGALNVTGYGGYGTQAGPIKFDASLSPSEVAEYLTSAFSINGFASNNKYTVNYRVWLLELGDTVSGVLPERDTQVDFTLTQTSKGGDINFEYPFNEQSKNVWSGVVGLYHVSQEYKSSINVFNKELLSSKKSADWTDFYIGIKNQHAFSETLVWENSVRIGAGGSDGYAAFNSSLVKTWTPSWETSLVFNVASFDYQNGEPIDQSFYLYDATESTFNLGVRYLF